MGNAFRRRDGFDGEKLISIPPGVLREVVNKNPALFQLYITHIGYFPKARFHYRERRKGCEDNILIYCVHGKGHCIIDDKQFQVAANQFILLPATEKYMRYWADTEDPWSIYWVHFTGNNMEGLNHSLQINPQKGPLDTPFNEKAIEIWLNIYRNLEMGYSLDNLANASMCLHYFIALFWFPQKHTSTHQNKKSDVIGETIAYMRSNLSKKLTIEDMANEHNLSSSHFSMLFRKATGLPPLDYFTHLKMQRACQLIYANDSRIKDIAMELGYSDPYYFSRVFSKNMGQSPEQYRMVAKKIT